MFLWAAAAAAQTPLGPEILLATSSQIVDKLQGGATVSCDQTSTCALVWTSASPDGQLNHSRQWGRTVSPAGQLSALKLLRADEGIGEATQSLPLNPGFALFSQTSRPNGVFVPNFRLYDETLSPLTGLIDQPFHEPAAFGDADSITIPGPTLRVPGGFVELGMAFDQPFDPSLCTVSYSCWDGVFLYFFNGRGRKLRERVQVNEDTAGDEVPGGIGIDGQGNLVVAFDRGTKTDSKVYVRRFTSAGVPLGPEVEASAGLPGINYESAVAVSPDGQFLVAWLNLPDTGSDFGRIYAQRFGAQGEPLGPLFRVSSDQLSQSLPQLTADRYGDYFVAWDSHESGTYDVHARLYRHDGRPVTRGELIINQDRSYDQLGGAASFAPNGTLTVSYGTLDPAVTGEEESLPLIRRYSASPGPEICTVSGAQIQCDLGRTGGAPELRLTWGGHRDEVTLFGDVDGDGREDVCSYLNGQFTCDVSHEGAIPYWRERFGSGGDLPLLGDVDGDGKADPCVWRKGGMLVCDTKHDGTENFHLPVGNLRGTPLLGDLDGDGKADLCLVNGASWSCLLSATGQLQQITFGKGGGSPALGDVNLDGKADPCVLRKGLLTCDTKHTGEPGDYMLQLDAPSNARLLFGNLDGL
jgi:hypothetical protein